MSYINLMLNDYRLTTVEILYHLPDHPHVLQTFIWQEYDLPPDFPRLRHFLEFWNRSIEGKLHSVKITSAAPLELPKTTTADFSWTIH